VTLLAPTKEDDVVALACPDAFKTASTTNAPLAENLTVPAGVAPPAFATTVAVKAIDWPRKDGLGEVPVTVVVVGNAPTFCKRTADVLLSKPGTRLATAVML
jgi:hypothetical protein